MNKAVLLELQTKKAMELEAYSNKTFENMAYMEDHDKSNHTHTSRQEDTTAEPQQEPDAMETTAHDSKNPDNTHL